jgi:hypothetical protein
MTHRKMHLRVACAAVSHGARRQRLVTNDIEKVDCIICLYHLGLYVPLVKLHGHQNDNKVRYGFQHEFFA